MVVNPLYVETLKPPLRSQPQDMLSILHSNAFEYKNLRLRSWIILVHSDPLHVNCGLELPWNETRGQPATGFLAKIHS